MSRNRSPSNNLASLSEATLSKLAESISQQTATSLVAIQVPEFSGGLKEDVRDFLRRYKTATINVGEELRCKSMQKALTGPAYTWAKNNIKGPMQDGAPGDWKKIKEALVQRFEAPNAELRYHEQLGRMKFDAQLGTLTSYIEAFHDCFKKVSKQAKDADIITALKLNLPNNIHRAMNLLDDDWTKLDDMKELYKLAKRVEEKILPFEKDDSGEEKLNASSIKKILTELVSTAKESVANETRADQKTEVLAAVQCNGQCQKNPPPTMPPGNVERQNDARTTGANYRGPFRNRFRASYGNSNPPRRPPGPYTQREQAQPPDAPSSKPNELQLAYERAHGRPPGPCYYCSGHHFNRHCPLNMSDLK